jgi:type III secretion system chaperone SycN
MSSLEAILGDLCRRLGMGEAPRRPSEPFTLEIEGVGLASLEEGPEGDQLLAILSWPLEPWDRAALVKALEACAPEKSLDFPLRAGLSGDKILLMVASPLSGLNAPAVENLILRLVKIRQSLIEP